MKLRRLAILISCFIILCSCSRDTPEYMLDNYLDRLSNVLEIERTPPSPRLLPLFPARRERIMQTEEVRQGLIEVLDLKQCNLIPLIAERNSSLGKVFPPSKKMVYELTFFHALRDCRSLIQHQEKVDLELQDRIEKIYQVKQRNLVKEVWNGLYLSAALEDNFSRGEQPLPLQARETSQANYEALFNLSQLVHLINKPNWDLPKNIQNLEQHYKVLYQNRSGGKLLQSINLLTYRLSEGADLILQRLNTRAMCLQKKTTPKARILKNVFHKYYIQEVQPYLAIIHQQTAQWITLNNQLLTQFQQLNLKLPKTMETYRLDVLSQKAEQGLWKKYIQARDKHTSAWQRILKQCDLMPSKS